MMDMNIDLNKLLEEIKAMDKDDPRKVLSQKIVDQRKNEKPQSLQELEEESNKLAEQLAKYND